MDKCKTSTYNEQRIRNTLKLADRVEVIREYDRHWKRPSIKSLAEKFNCSTYQITNILYNRKSILEAWRKGSTGPQKQIYTHTDLLQRRQEKIDFLGKVLYEYLQRMLYFNQNIDYHKFRLKALQIKDCLAVENFEPADDWMEDFKMTYNIEDFDLKSLRNNIVITEAKRPLLSAIDMIQYVNRKLTEGTAPKTDVGDHVCTPNPLEGDSSNEPKIIYKIEDNEDEEIQKLKCNDLPIIKSPPAPNSIAANTSKNVVKRRAPSPLPDIESVDEALKYVKALEEYAMLNNNFRAIGLLTQLEQTFQKNNEKEEEDDEEEE